MGDGGVDPQKLKKIAAEAYDYENDPRWKNYWDNVLIPPDRAARSDVVLHYKCKFYQRFIDPNLVVEPLPSTNSSQSSGTSSRPQTQPSTRPQTQGSSEQSRPRNSGSNTSASSVRRDPQTIQFTINAWVLILATLGVLPFMPRNLSNKTVRLTLLGTACSTLYSLYNLYGKPRAWNLPAVQTWLQSVVGTKDFIYFIYCLTFVSSQSPFKFALIPVACRSSEYVAKFLRRNFQHSSIYRKYLEDSCLWIEANTATLSILSSNAEVALGFLFILSLFSWQRSIMQMFMYWQLLKLMYHAPATASYHQAVWTKIGGTLNPYIHRYAPFLATPISVLQRWWLR
ncbi:dihydroflavonol 4-reductase/flavanone protein [Wolffia australiana]